MSQLDNNLWALLISFGLTLSVAIFGALLVKFKPKLSSSGMRKMYAWTCGFIAILSTIGLFGGAVEMFMSHFNLKMGDISFDSIWVILLLLFAMSVAGGIFYLIDRKFQEPTELVDEVSTKKFRIDSRWKAIITLMIHRIPEGLAAGFIISQFDNKIGLIIVMGVHVFPEKIIIYYRLSQIKEAGWKSYSISLLKQMISFVFSIVGIFLSPYLVPDNVYTFWIMPLLFIVAACMMTITIFFEIAPEFTGIRFRPINTWYFMLGVSLALIPLSLGN